MKFTDNFIKLGKLPRALEGAHGECGNLSLQYARYMHGRLLHAQCFHHDATAVEYLCANVRPTACKLRILCLLYFQRQYKFN